MSNEELANLIAGVDLHSLRVIPDGAGKPIPPTTQEDYTLTPADVRRAIRRWDEIMPEWAGILEAEIAA